MNLAWTASPLWLIINALVAYRLTRLWISDTLPPLPMIRAWIRERGEARWDRITMYRPSMPDAQIIRRRRLREQYDAPPLTNLLDCYWCAGFWISLATVLAASLAPPAIWTIPALALALSALVGILGRHDD